MIEIREFERYVLPFMDNVPTVAVDDALRDAAIEFCAQARVVRETLPAISLLPVLPEMEIEATEAGTVVHEVMGAWLYGRPLKAASNPELNEIFSTAWRSARVSRDDEITHFYQRLPNLIQLVPSAAEKLGNALVLEVVIKPTRDTLYLPDVLFNHFAEAISYGAMARLNAHISKEYADISKVSAYTNMFESAIQSANDLTQKGFQHTILRSGISDCFI